MELKFVLGHGGALLIVGFDETLVCSWPSCGLFYFGIGSALAFLSCWPFRLSFVVGLCGALHCSGPLLSLTLLLASQDCWLFLALITPCMGISFDLCLD